MKYQLALLFFLVVPFLYIAAQDNQKSPYEKAKEAFDNKHYDKAAELFLSANLPFEVARCYALIGNEKQAAIYLERASSNRSQIYSEIMLLADFDNIRNSKPFQQLAISLRQDSVVYTYDIVMDMVNKPDSVLTYRNETIEFSFSGELLQKYGLYDSGVNRTYFDKSLEFYNCEIFGYWPAFRDVGFKSLSLVVPATDIFFINIDVDKFTYYNSGVDDRYEDMKVDIKRSRFGELAIGDLEVSMLTISENVIGHESGDTLSSNQSSDENEEDSHTIMSLGSRFYGEFYFVEVPNLVIRDNEFIGSERQQLSIIANVNDLIFENNRLDVNLNLDKLKIKDSFSFVGNELKGYVSLYSALFSEFYNEIPWAQLKGNRIVVIEDELGSNKNDPFFDCWYCSINRGTEHAELLNEVSYERLVNSYYKLYQIYETRGDLVSANGCYAEMKDLTGRRLNALYDRDGGFKNYIRWKLNRLLKVYTNHGTDTALPIAISIYVILAFSVFYFFFPSEWDVTSKSKLLHDFKEFKTKNDKGYIRPFLVLIAGLFVSLINAFTLSVNAFVTLGFGSIPTSGLARYVCILQGFIGWFLLSIFTVTLINQVLF